jgi:hypothetical protein
MIGWFHPIALAGLLAVAGPVVVHLLRRQKAARVPFPSLRFVQPTRTAAVRLRLPSDPWLLAIRAAIVGLAAAALAQPVLITGSRRRAWDSRIARAIVIDASPSTSAWMEAAREAAAAEARGAAAAVTLEEQDVGAAVRRAALRLGALVPARREIVVISDFQQGALAPADVAAVPAGTGVRFVAVGQPQTRAEFAGDALLGSARLPFRQQTVTLDSRGTSVTLQPTRESLSGLRLVAAGLDVSKTEAVIRAVARSGAPAPDAGQPVTVVFAGGTVPSAARLTVPWMVQAVARMRETGTLLDAAAASQGTGTPSGPAWTPIALDARGAPVVSAAASSGDLVVFAAARPDSFVAAAAVDAVLRGRRGDVGWPEREIARIPQARLAAWTREPGPLPEDAGRQGAPGDARWAWAGVLVLLALETIVRRAKRGVREEVRAHAA